MRYETEKDREIENEILTQAIELQPGCQWNARKITGKNEWRYHADFFVTDGGSKKSFFLEVKDRRTWNDSFDSVLLDVCKWRNLLSLSAATGLPCVFMPRLAGKIFALTLSREIIPRANFVWIGRTDRNDPDDGQPCIMIPLNLFREVGA
tara:strand:+ start:2322 stop:2771 length:450 start_codon:yes stop_codon:yes gene_type:complete